jgi:hypothetical protein
MPIGLDHHHCTETFLTSVNDVIIDLGNPKQSVKYRDDRRGGDRYPPRDFDRRGGGYDDRRGGYDDRRGGYDDRRGGYDDRRGGYDDRRGGYDDRRGGYPDPRYICRS